MAEFILHHYAASLFSEKVRAMFGAKRLAWRSVDIPVIAPKPDLMALTGGYRRTPVMQIGADIYCDTALIARVLDAHAAQCPLHTPAYAAAGMALTRWADTQLFWACVSLRFQPAAMTTGLAGFPDMGAFMQDRANFSKGSTVRSIPLDEAGATVNNVLRELEGQLGDGRQWLFGGTLSIADFAIYHNLWFLQGSPFTAALITPFPAVAAFVARMRDLGHGTPTAMSGGEAIAVARAATPAVITPFSDVAELPPGAQVHVHPADYGVMPTTGELLLCNDMEIAVRRSDERAGEIVVHFPRIAFTVRAA